MNFSNIIERFKDLIGIQFVLTKEWNKQPQDVQDAMPEQEAPQEVVTEE